ncbi:hypothetical protein ACOMHN_059179 [Nucella lapillus]
MKLVLVCLVALLVIAAACPDGYSTVNQHCHDNSHCLSNSDCNHSEECCFPDNGDCNSICSAHSGGPAFGK